MDSSVQRVQTNMSYICIGGESGIGVTHLCKDLSKELNLRLISTGNIFRQTLKNKLGFDRVSDFMISRQFGASKIDEIDKLALDKTRELIKEFKNHGIIVDSKLVAPLSHKDLMPVPDVSFWLKSNLEDRTLWALYRTLALPSLETREERDRVLNTKFSAADLSKRLEEEKERLVIKQNLDTERFNRKYGIDYQKPELYYDHVFDTTTFETFRALHEKLERMIENLKN